MADWTTLDLETLLPGEPLTSAKVTAMYENPIAISEGATDAPKIQTKALDLDFVEGVGPHLNLDGVSRMLIVGTIQINDNTDSTSGGAGQYRLSSDNGATWGAWVTFIQGWDAFGTSTSSRTRHFSGTTIVNMDAANAIQFQETVTGGSGSIAVTGLGVAGK